MSVTRTLLAALLAVPLSAAAAELSDAFVERELGVAGVRHAPSRYDKTTLVYRDGSGRQLFTLKASRPQTYDEWKTTLAEQIEPLAGVGSEAFAYRRLATVCARSATAAVCASSVPTATAPALTRAQLAALVRAAL